MSEYKIAKTLRVVREGTGHARLYIDGEPFDYATVDGFTVHPRAGNEMLRPSPSRSPRGGWRLTDDIDAEAGRAVARRRRKRGR